MKIRILSESFLLPILFGCLIAMKQIYPNLIFNYAVGTGVIIGWIFRILFDRKKYLITYTSKENQIEITYLTFYLKKEKYFAEKNFIQIIYENSNWKSLDYADSLKIIDRNENKEIEFRILGKGLKNCLKKELNFID